MFDFITGKLVEVKGNSIVVETSGIGFDMFFPLSNVKNLPNIGMDIKIYTYMNVKEDEISLYGFLTKEDKDMFLKLLTVNGVGPKGALNIISNFGFSDLMKAIASEDDKIIASVPGIGKKTASKICIELGDKVRKMTFEGKVDIIKQNKIEANKVKEIKEEVIAALIKLGIKENAARERLSKLDITEDMTADELLKLSFK